MSGNGDGPPPGGMIIGALLMVGCCVGLPLLAGGGAAAMGGYFGDNLWLILGGVAIAVVGLFLMKGQGAAK